MKKIAFFCIPAHGHTNPMLPVAAQLIKRGNSVRFYSFNEFKEKITATGAEYAEIVKANGVIVAEDTEEPSGETQNPVLDTSTGDTSVGDTSTGD